VLLLLLFQEANQWPALGRTGTVIGFVLLIASAIGNLLQARGMRWKGTAEAYQSELVVVRERADRETSEKAELQKEVAKLHERTDLRPLQQQMVDLQSKLVDSMDKQSTRFEATLAANTKALTELTEHICSHSAQEEKAFAGLASAITAVEQRLILGTRSRAKAK
jgi:uncharacterized membrane protein YccC